MWVEVTLLIHFVTYSTATSGPNKPHSKFIDGTLKGKESWLVASIYFQTELQLQCFCINTQDGIYQTNTNHPTFTLQATEEQGAILQQNSSHPNEDI